MCNAPWLTGPQLRAWMRFVAVVELLPGVLDTQLQRDAQLSHFEYFVMAMLSEAPDKTLRMTDLADHTNATLPRLSHVVARLEKRGLVARTRCAEDRRATNATLTESGWEMIQASAPGHVRNVRDNVIDLLTDEQVGQLEAISEALLQKLDPANRMHVRGE
ncbi:MarR family winged helix-turn-helix transcriptional regulator [Cryobacterium tepidiphilum]|uniref:MarR family transcriptional regulator n=1 Tax=Cryobacterium tepidiphilum TaxID=2486026 RepID=A0A3M8LA18_9MICO|nr:MarR family transcriptional regulator [Cryobacterium tepidiphilum]RNE62300.1 MarR family transcriptional regulator [Cryobacterium tepidiphilum]